MKKKIVVLTGAGMSVESGLRTFRDADGLWEEYPVQQVATHEGWEADPTLVTNFYNMLRKKCWGVKPNEGHKLPLNRSTTSPLSPRMLITSTSRQALLMSSTCMANS